MPPDHAPEPQDPEQIRKQFEEMIAGMGLDELRETAGQVLAYGARGVDVAPPEPTRRRTPRREDVVTYRVRVDLADAQPPIWRRLELASDLFLDRLHDIVQTAFGWTDSHLHVFTLASSPYDRAAERYLCPFDVEEGDADEGNGVPEEEVRLDEVIAEVGETMLYEYDYGDGWTHRIRLEAVLPRGSEAPAAVCTDGRRAGPFEDSGGIPGYESMVAAAADPANPDNAEELERLEHYAGTRDFDPAHLDLTEVNELLTSVLKRAAIVSDRSVLGRFLSSLRASAVGEDVEDLLTAAGLDQPVLVDADDAARMVRRYAWLLERAKDGIKLTSAGYLPPLHVEAAVHELGLAEEWIGKGNREVQTYPVLGLRESAQRMGLLRKHRGTLLLTKAGKSVADDPVALWWHIASRLPAGKDGSVEQHAGIGSLLTVAARQEVHGGRHRLLLREVLTALGWRSAGVDGEIDEWQASRAAWDTDDVLRHLGVVPSMISRDAVPTSGGRALAKAALARLAHN